MPESSPPPKEPFTFWHGLLLAEGTAAAIGLLMPITRTRSGAERGFAQQLLVEPSYLEQALVYFVMTNLLIAVLALAGWAWVRWSGGTGKR